MKTSALSGLLLASAAALGMLGLPGCSPMQSEIRYRQFLGPIASMAGPESISIPCQLTTESGAAPLPGPKFELLSKAGAILIESDADGRIALPRRPEILQENPPLRKLYSGKLHYEIKFTGAVAGRNGKALLMSVQGKPHMEVDRVRVWYPPGEEETARALLSALQSQAQCIHRLLGLSPVPWAIDLISAPPAGTDMMTAQDQPGWSIWTYATGRVQSGEYVAINVHEWTEATLDHHLDLAGADGSGRNRVWTDGLAEYVATQYQGKQPPDYAFALYDLIARGATHVDLTEAFRSLRGRTRPGESLRQLIDRKVFPAGYPLSFAFWEQLAHHYGRDLPNRFTQALQGMAKRDFPSCAAALERLTPGTSIPATLKRMDVAAAARLINQTARPFYLAENRNYTIVQSALDSIRFTLEKTVQPDAKGHLVSISSFVDPEARVMGWHDFGNLEGPGWAANAAGGSWEIYRWGAFLRDADYQKKALAILDHVLEGGFIDATSGFIRPYRETTSGRFCLNYKHNNDWLCPGSLAKVASQFVLWADELPTDPRAERLRMAALKFAAWIDHNLEPVPNGWFARRADMHGRVYRKTPEGGHDAFWQTSADGLFILQLQAALTERGLADYRPALKAKAEVFVKAGGIFGSINHDTYDPRENVAYSVAFRTLLAVARVLNDPALRQFGYEKCLSELERFQMTEDRHGVATKGLLYMEDTWDTAYLWENAEAALAYFEAATDTRPINEPQSRRYELNGLTILRAMAKHHHGKHGFLTEGVDWNNHVGQQHHVNQSPFGAIQYTEPFLNNQHIAEPTLFYLLKLARHSHSQPEAWRDLEGTVVWGSAVKRPGH